MIAVALGITWAGYYLAIWGFCLTKGYDVTFPMLFKATWPGPAAAPAASTPATDPGTGTYNV